MKKLVWATFLVVLQSGVLDTALALDLSARRGGNCNLSLKTIAVGNWERYSSGPNNAGGPYAGNKKAFTLIELLVVVAIIGTLASLLLPALGRAKSKAKAIQCLNNHKQLMLAFHEYADDHEGYFPPNGYPEPPNQTWVGGAFVHAPDETNVLKIIDHNLSLLANYIDNPKLYVDPADPEGHARSYAMNPYANWTGGWDSRMSANGWQFFRTLGEANVSMSASSMFILGDVLYQSNCRPYFGVQMVKNQFFNFPNNVHDARGMFSYLDGHAEISRKWKSALLRHPPKRSRGFWHQHADDVRSPEELDDLNWLRSRTTAPVQIRQPVGPNSPP